MSGENVIGALNEPIAPRLESSSSLSSLRDRHSMPDRRVSSLSSHARFFGERGHHLSRRRPKRRMAQGPTPVPEQRPFPTDARLPGHRVSHRVSLEEAAVHTEWQILQHVGGIPFVALIDALIESDQVKAAERLAEIAVAASGENPRLIALRELLSPPKILAQGPAVEQDRRLETEWLKTHRQDYRGQWVAVSQRGLLAHAGTLRDLLAAIGTVRPLERPLIYRFD